MTRGHNRSGFTLVEMLVVIAIIVLLVAFLVPTIQSARHKARMAECQTKLGKLVGALEQYKRQYHKYPPRPIYDATAELYIGGFSALYPKFIDSWNDLVCPDDRTIFGKGDEAKKRRYCSYNGVINMAVDPSASDPWEFATDSDTGNQMVTYNFNGYDEKGWDRDTPLTPGVDPTPTWLDRGWKYYPRLSNIYAPEYTVIAHCTFHRDFYHSEQDKRDTYVRLSGVMDELVVQVWEDDSGGVTMFEKQEP